MGGTGGELMIQTNQVITPPVIELKLIIVTETKPNLKCKELSKAIKTQIYMLHGMNDLCNFVSDF